MVDRPRRMRSGAVLVLAAVLAGCTERESDVTPTGMQTFPGSPPAPTPATTSPVAAFTKPATLGSLAAGTGPRGVAVAPPGFPTGGTLVAGDRLVAVPGQNQVIRIDASGTASTFAAEGSLADTGAGSLANLGLLVAPQDVAIDTAGRTWVATASGGNGNGGTGNLMVLDASGRVILQGSTPAVVQAGAFNQPVSVEWNGGSGSAAALFVASAGAGALHRVAVNATALASSTATTIATGITAPGLQFLAHDPAADRLFATVAATGVDELRAVAGASTVAAGDHDVLVSVAAGTFNVPTGVAVNDQGNAVVANRGAGTLVEVTPLGGVLAPLTTAAGLSALRGLAASFTAAEFVLADDAADLIRTQQVPSFGSDLQPIFNARCSGFSCHTGGAGSLTLSSGSSHGNLVNVTSSQVAPDLRVRPGNPATGTGGSYLMEKLRLASPRSGSQMPATGGPLSAAQIDLFDGWIRFGAPNN